MNDSKIRFRPSNKIMSCCWMMCCNMGQGRGVHNTFNFWQSACGSSLLTRGLKGSLRITNPQIFMQWTQRIISSFFSDQHGSCLKCRSLVDSWDSGRVSLEWVEHHELLENFGLACLSKFPCQEHLVNNSINLQKIVLSEFKVTFFHWIYLIEVEDQIKLADVVKIFV